MVDAVVKVGGRLGHDEGLRGLCLRLAELGRRHRLLVVPGGGVFADAVRDCDARFGLGADAAHWMAILAMDQYGLLLGELIPGARLTRSFDAAAGPAAEGVVSGAAREGAASELAGGGAVTVLLPHDLLREADPLPHSWAVTSDAIAAWVADAVRAPRLVLLKHGAALGGLASASLTGLGEAGVVDEAFAGVVEAGRASGAGFDVWLLDGGRPERLEALLATGRADGVRAGP
ncbi:MAG TPA: hypothetical protein VLA35_11045 [Thermoleophilia bacterium]|nr:hypothetical protein [Thermoleophilia bacterium]